MVFWQWKHRPDQHLSGAAVGTDVSILGGFDPQHHPGFFFNMLI